MVKYTACMGVRGSDHKPVCALMCLKAKLDASADARHVLLRALQDEQLHLEKRLVLLRQHQQSSANKARLSTAEADVRRRGSFVMAVPSTCSQTLVDLEFVSRSSQS